MWKVIETSIYIVISIFILACPIAIIIAIETAQPVYYQVTTYNMDGTKKVEFTEKIVIHEFSGTYSYRTTDNRYIKVPIKNTNVETLNVDRSTKVSTTP